MSLYYSPATLAKEREARAEIVKHEACISVLQSQINDLFQRITSIENEKRNHDRTIKQCLSVLSLASRIPGELLARIFELAVFDGWTLGPVVVSQVCLSWREAAKAPSIWSQVYIDCDRGDPTSRCKLWFSMVRDSLLDVTFRTSMHATLTQSAFAIVNNRVDHWRSLHLDSHTLELANLTLSQMSGTADHLKDITIVVADSSAPTAVIGEELQQPVTQLYALVEAVRDAPNLKRVTIIADHRRVWVGLPQITTLNLQLSDTVFETRRPIFASEIMDVLEASPNLRELSIGIPRDGERALADLAGEPIHIVTLTHLKTLTLEMPIAFMSIMKHFEAPRLQSLYLRCPDAIQSFAEDMMRAALLRFLDRSHAPLRTLHLYDVDVAQDDFCRIFSEVPTIENIFLHGSDILDETLLYLASPPFLLPRLQQMEFRWCGHITGEAIERVVRARFDQEESEGAVRPLEELTLISCSGVKENEILKIAEICRCRLKTRDYNDFCRKSYVFKQRCLN